MDSGLMRGLVLLWKLWIFFPLIVFIFAIVSHYHDEQVEAFLLIFLPGVTLVFTFLVGGHVKDRFWRVVMAVMTGLYLMPIAITAFICFR